MRDAPVAALVEATLRCGFSLFNSERWVKRFRVLSLLDAAIQCCLPAWRCAERYLVIPAQGITKHSKMITNTVLNH